jgi:hypothetical protein
MNFHPSQLIPFPSRPLTERVITTLRTMLTRWDDYKARRWEARASDTISDMNEYMLRDIGAPDPLIAYAAARRATRERRQITAASLLAAGLIATATPAWAAEATNPQSTSAVYAQAQTVGVFTGQLVDGVPIYRLPPVVVVGTPKGELAKIEREEQSTRAKQARARAAARHPA